MNWLRNLRDRISIHQVGLVILVSSGFSMLWIAFYNPWLLKHSVPQFMILWFWILFYYLVISVPAIALIGLRTFRSKWSKTLVSAYVVVAAVWFTGITIWHSPRLLVEWGTPWWHQANLIGFFLVLHLIIVILVVFSDVRPGILVYSLAIVCFFSLFVIAAYQNIFLVRDIPRIDGVNRETPTVVIGLDGADWDYLNPMMKNGELPNLRRLRQQGSWGHLSSIKPTSSPVIWTSIATGKPPREHGITWFTGKKIYGSDEIFPEMTKPFGTGLDAIMKQVRRVKIPMNQYHRREYSYWEVANRQDVPVTVQNWWMTWPARPIQGNMITERIHYRGFGIPGKQVSQYLTYPPSLMNLVRTHTIRPNSVDVSLAKEYLNLDWKQLRKLLEMDWSHHDIEGEFQYIISVLETNRRIASEMAQRGRKRGTTPPDQMVLFRAPDLAGHSALKYSSLEDRHGSATEKELNKYGSFYGNVLRKVDEAVGEILSHYERANVIVLSDHGFEAYGEGEDLVFDHDEAPDGIWIASGPAFRSDRKRRIGLFDVYPLLLRTKNLPIPTDLEGTVPKDLFTDRFRSGYPRNEVAPFGPRIPDAQAGRSGKTDRKMKEHLEALGYI